MQITHSNSKKIFDRDNDVENRKAPLLIIFSIWVVCTLIASGLFWKHNKAKELNHLRTEAENLAFSFEALLNRFKPLSKVLVNIPQLISPLSDPRRENIEITNNLLKNLNNDLGTEKIFLLDSKGKTIATSNANENDSVLGEDFSFSPFFEDARANVDGDYHAAGTINRKLGRYFSRSIDIDGEFSGVLVTKVNLERIKSIVNRPGRRFMISDANGVVFISSNKNWLFKLIPGSNPEKLKQAEISKQYGDALLSSPLFECTSAGFAELVSMAESSRCRSFLHSDSTLRYSAWKIHLLKPRSLVVLHTFGDMVLLSLAYWLIIFFVLFYKSHRRHQLYLESEKEILEDRVESLTSNLREKNIKLEASVNHHLEAKKALENAQDELIKAERLAILGEVSVSLHHELNQPILAIKTYADNGVNFLELNKEQQTKNNLIKINNIADNMAEIIAQFKVFARRESEAESVNLADALRDSLMILQPKINQSGVQIEKQVNSELPTVLCNKIHIQQVMMNLIVNAIQALEHTALPQIGIKIDYLDDKVYFRITDNGTGLKQDTESLVFTPFFTTKPSGLGLGLPLSKRLIEANGGQIFVDTNAQGTTFCFELPRAVSP